MPTSFAPSITGKWRNRCLCMSFSASIMVMSSAAGCDVARHQVANVPVGQPGSLLGERAHHVALGDDLTSVPWVSADREGSRC